MFYSSTNVGFYPKSLKAAYEAAGKWPVDAIAITDEEYEAYGKGQPPTGKRLGADADGRPTWAEIPPEPTASRRARQLNAIDTAAGSARLRYVSAGQLIEEEYRQAKFAVEEWRAAGSPADAVPPEIVSGAEYTGITHEDAAVEIEQTAET